MEPFRDNATPLDSVRTVGLVAWIGIALSAAMLVAFRLHAFDLPLETDECNYIYIGGRLLAGDRLYVDVWDHQPHGVFVLFAGVIALFGDAPEVFRWMTTVFSLASLALVFGIAWRAAGPIAAMVAAALFAMASSDPGTAGEGCNRELFMNTFILAAWYLAMVACLPDAAERLGQTNASRPRRSVLLLGAGLALGLASLLKTIVAVHWIVLAAWVAWMSGGFATSIASIAWLGALPALLWGGSFAYFAATDRWDVFLDAVFAFNVSYADTSESVLFRFVRFFAPIKHPFIFASALPLWLAGGVGWFGLLLIACIGRPRAAVAVLLLVLAGFVAVCMPGRFWPHYYYLLIAPLAIAAVTGAVLVLRQIASIAVWSERARRGATLGVCGALFLALLWTQYRDYLNQPLFGITVKRYNSRDFWGRGQGENVRRVTDESDEVFVFGNDASIYYYSGRRCASRYTMITGLASGMAGAERRREILLGELEENPPRVIVVLFDEKPFDGWLRFVAEHYGEAVGVDYHDRNGDIIMLVFARRDHPIEKIDWDWDRSSVGGWMLGDEP